MLMVLQVDKMTCNHCVSVVSKAVQAVDSKALVQIDLASGTVSISSKDAAMDSMVTAIEDAGYPVLEADAK